MYVCTLHTYLFMLKCHLAENLITFTMDVFLLFGGIFAKVGGARVRVAQQADRPIDVDKLRNYCASLAMLPLPLPLSLSLTLSFSSASTSVTAQSALTSHSIFHN